MLSDSRVMWLLIWWLLEVYMIANFRVHKINRDACKLTNIKLLLTNIINLFISTSIYVLFNLIFPYQSLMNFFFFINTLNYCHHTCNYSFIYNIFHSLSKHDIPLTFFIFIEFIVIFPYHVLFWHCIFSIPYFILWA